MLRELNERHFCLSVSLLLIKRSASESILSARWSVDPFHIVLTWAAKGAEDIGFFPNDPRSSISDISDPVDAEGASLNLS